MGREGLGVLGLLRGRGSGEGRTGSFGDKQVQTIIYRMYKQDPTV